MPADLKEFDDLVAALEAERPQIDPGFARELDARAAAGFRRRRRWALKLPDLTSALAPTLAAGLLVVVVGGAALVAGGDGSGGDTATSAGGGISAAPEAEVAEDVQLQEESSASGASRAKPAPGPGLATGPNRVQELSAQMTLVAPAAEVPDVGAGILRVVRDVGGFVVSSNLYSTDGDSGSGDYQLRIPTDRLDEGLADLGRLAHVREQSQGVLDITSQRNVARERLGEARAERASLLNRLAEADTDTEVAALRAQLADVNDVIGRARAQLTKVKRRADYASVAVQLLAEGDEGSVVVPDDGKWTPGDALRDAGRVLEVAAGVLVIAAAVLLPLALLALAFAAARRLLGHRGRERVLDAV